MRTRVILPRGRPPVRGAAPRAAVAAVGAPATGGAGGVWRSSRIAATAGSAAIEARKFLRSIAGLLRSLGLQQLLDLRDRVGRQVDVAGGDGLLDLLRAPGPGDR